VPVGDVGIDNQIYRPPAGPNWEQAWRVTEAILKMFHAETAANNARLVVVTGSNGIQVWPDATARMAFAKRLGVDDLLYPDRRISEFAMNNSIGSITLVDHLRQYAEQNNAYLHGFGDDLGNGHWNQLGHRVAGELIGQKLCEELSR